MKRLCAIHILMSFILIFLISCGITQKADLILLNGKIVTVDDAFSIREAVAVKNSKILFVGTNQHVDQFIGKKTKVIHLDGKLVLPGLIDSHAHLHSLGNELSYLNTTGTTSYQEIIDKVAEKVKSMKPCDWIIGGRWDHTDWTDKRFPVHDRLSNVSSNNPVYLTRVDGNSAFVNAKALQIAGVTRETPDPPGGVIHRRRNGEPTGVLINQAMNLVKDHLPPDSDEMLREKFLKAVESCLSVGLTSVHEAGIGPREIKLHKDLIDNNQLDLRVYAMLGEQEKPTFQVDDLAEYFRENKIEDYGDAFLSVRSIKLFFDGALGSRGAAFFEPYQDDPANRGLLRTKPEYITEVAKAALANGMGVNTHCIGIRGNRLCLDAYEKALKEFTVKDHRFRIEHAQIVRREDVEKFKALNVLPAMQPTHCTSDMGFVVNRVGEKRAEGAYAWRWFLDAGLPIPCGSDFPVESNNPMLGIYAAVTRQDVRGNPAGGWFPEQRMTREEAVKGFTIWAAHSGFQEDILGSIEVGKYADFTVLDKDILEIDAEEILTTKVLYTIVAGKIRYQTN